MADDGNFLDTAGLAVLARGELRETGNPWKPFELVDADGGVVAPVAGGLRHPQAPRGQPRHAGHPAARGRIPGSPVTRDPGTPRTRPMRQGRQADSARRRQRVTAAINKASADGAEISVSAIARAAGVDRTFLYRHRDLLAQVHALEAAPPVTGAHEPGTAVTRASLQADLLAAHERATRLTARIRQLEKRLSESLGEQAWRESGLGAPADIDALTQKITYLEQQSAPSPPSLQRTVPPATKSYRPLSSIRLRRSWRCQLSAISSSLKSRLISSKRCAAI